MDAKKGTWVRIHNIVLKSEERSPHLPEDTRKVPLEMWVKGFLLNDEANIGDMVEVETYKGRREKGKLAEANPYYTHSFGKCVPELLYIGRQLRGIISKEGDR